MTTFTATPDLPTRAGAPPDRMRRASLWAGVMYLLTFVSVPTLALYASVKEPGFMTGAGSDTAVIVGGALELVVGLTCIGTAVALYPVVRRQDEMFAMGFVGTRILEAALIFAGVAALWTMVSVRDAGVVAGGEATAVGQLLATFYDKAFLVSQSLIPTFNALLLGTLLYRSRLVPRWLPTLGLVGAFTLLAWTSATALGVAADLPEVLALVAVLPIATWEFSLGVYLVVKGFRPEAVARLDTVAAVPGSPWPGARA